MAQAVRAVLAPSWGGAAPFLQSSSRFLDPHCAPRTPSDAELLCPASITQPDGLGADHCLQQQRLSRRDI